MSLFAWNCRGLGSSLAFRILTDEMKVKDSTLIFLAATKARVSQMKGIEVSVYLGDYRPQGWQEWQTCIAMEGRHQRQIQELLKLTD